MGHSLGDRATSAHAAKCRGALSFSGTRAGLPSHGSDRKPPRGPGAGYGGEVPDEVAERPSRTQRWGSRLRPRLPSPALRTELLQDVKAVVAAVAAWVLADGVLDLHHAFLAPWVALLTVHATVHRSLRRGGETVLAVALGLLVAFVAAQVVPTPTWALAVALLVGLTLARLRPLGAEGVTVATSALFVIAAGDAASEPRAMEVLPDRFAAVAIGVGLAVLVNVLVVPPLDDWTTQRRIDDVDRRLGRLLVDMAEGMAGQWSTEDAAGWVEETRSIDGDLDQAWSLVRYSHESRRWNPRRRRHPSTGEFDDVLERLEEGVAEVRGIARHLVESGEGAHPWPPAFGERYVRVLHELGRRVAEPGADVADLRDDVQRLVDDLSEEIHGGLDWPLAGALLANVRTVVDVVDDVATARRVRS